MNWSRRFRIVILVIGLALVCCSLAALTYALWPADIAGLQTTLEPTLFTPP